MSNIKVGDLVKIATEVNPTYYRPIWHKKDIFIVIETATFFNSNTYELKLYKTAFGLEAWLPNCRLDRSSIIPLTPLERVLINENE